MKKPNPDEIYKYIEDNQNTPLVEIVRYLMSEYGLRERIAINAVMQWSLGNEQWFKDTFV